MRTVMAALFALAFVAGCKGKQSSSATGGSSAGSATAATGSSAAAGSSADPWAAGSGSGAGSGSDVGSGAGSGSGSAASFVPPKLDEKQGVIFADKQGGKPKSFADGTLVEVVSVKDMGVGSQDSGEVTVKTTDGRTTVKLPADRVIIEEALKRSPDGKYFVFAPIVACGDFCHSIVWFIAADGRRVKLGDGGPETIAAYSPDGKSAAVGSANLWLVTLADLKVKNLSGYMSPAYGPDGTLYVRDHSGSAFTVAGDKPKRVWKAPKLSEEEDEMNASEEPRPVQFKDGKPVFDEPWWNGPGTDQ